MWRCDPTLATLVFDITMQKVTKKPYELAQGDSGPHVARSADFRRLAMLASVTVTAACVTAETSRRRIIHSKICLIL